MSAKVKNIGFTFACIKIMNPKLFILLILTISSLSLSAQLSQADSSDILQEVIIKGYEQNRRSIETGASVGTIKQQDLTRFSPGSLVPAINTIPGVRMEERSPASYRLSIRGSSLRSPFGVRNVKMYIDGIPFTDAGGNSYLNQLSPNAISSMEVQKGPGSSMYGAGTGGVVLLSTERPDTGRWASIDLSAGSFGARNIFVNAGSSNERSSNSISYAHQQADGFRQQSATRRDLFSWSSRVNLNDKQSIAVHMIYGDLYYQTPGALTAAEVNTNYKQSRPAAGGFPSAVQNQASIYQKTFWTGIEHSYKFNDNFSNRTSVYGNFSQVLNPAVRNYERRNEPGFGGRTVFNLEKGIFTLTAGAEFQQGYSVIRVYNNTRGNPDSLQTDDEVKISQASVFAQGDLKLGDGWIITGGASINATRVNITRFSVRPVFAFNSDFRNEIAPRLSILKKLAPDLSVYALVSKGFSPPTAAELLPSTTVINTSLQAEKGVNIEGGIKGNFFRSRVRAELSVYNFQLENTITQRRDASGADYFVNTGNSRQRGVEISAAWDIIRNSNAFVSRFNLWGNYAYQHYRYGSYKQLANDFSGNKIPGVAPNTLSGGLILNTSPGIFVNLTSYYSDHIYLNDANSAIAKSYAVAGFRVGYRLRFSSHFGADIYASGDNLFDQHYSLGNDINAAGNRYYNVATGRNFQGGLILKWF